jgi:isopenicillin-N epimerase
MTGSMAALAVPRHARPVPAPEVASSAPPTGSPEAAPDAELTLSHDPLHDALIGEDRVEVPVYPWPPTFGHGRAPTRLLRLSAQAYNALEDYERLAAALRRRIKAR